jgi:hypothetical protein
VLWSVVVARSHAMSLTETGDTHGWRTTPPRDMPMHILPALSIIAVIIARCEE